MMMPMNLSLTNFIGMTIFSGIGFVAFMYGKKQGQFRLMLVGLLLMGYSYFVSNTALGYLIGAVLTVVAWYVRD